MAIGWARKNCLIGSYIVGLMIAESEYETVRCERVSSLIVAAKARVWASEEWHVTTTDGDGKVFSPAEFEDLFAEPFQRKM